MDTNFLPVKPFQETLHSSFCGPAVIKMILDFYGLEKSESEIADMSGNDSSLGIGETEIRKVLESFNLKVETKNFANYSDLENWLAKGIPVIVDWFTRGRSDYHEDEVADGHYSIVVGLDQTHIYLQDPEVARVRKISREDFLRVWFDFSSDHIEKWEDLVVRQAIAVYK